MTAFRVSPQPLKPSRKPVRSDRYLQWIRKQPSVVSHHWPVEACHTGPHARGVKADDFDAIPLTKREHEAFGRDPRGFAALHGLDIPALIRDLNQRYSKEVLELEEMPGRKPAGREGA